MNYKDFQIGTLGAYGDRKRFGCAVGGAVADCGENGRASKAAKRRLESVVADLVKVKAAKSPFGGSVVRSTSSEVQRLEDEAERSMSGAFPCHARNKLPIESIGVKLCPFWEQPGCH
jgi:hypothetical protein